MRFGASVSVLSTLALAATGLSLVTTASPAAAAAGDGTVKIRVVQDYNGNGTWDDPFVEPGLAGVSVKVTDESGTTQDLLTDGDGMVTVVGAPGSYRIQVADPDGAGILTAAPAWATPKPAKPRPANALSSNEEFVTVAADKTVEVTTAFWDVRDYCNSNPRLADACQLPVLQRNGRMGNTDGMRSVFTGRYRGNGTDVGTETLATYGQTGAVYGIGYHRDSDRVFAGAFAKRGTKYGDLAPVGSKQGAIYVMDASGGGATLWGTVPDAGSTEHDFDAAETGGVSVRQDWDFAAAVGKESLGDLDISEDGDRLQVLNLNNRRLYVYDATTPTMGAPLNVVDVSANPGCAAPSDWRPGALAERRGVLYVGGVCTGESTQDADDMRAIVLAYDAAAPYAFQGKVMDQPLHHKRQGNAGSVCLPQGLEDGVVNTQFRPWSDDGISCTNGVGFVSDPSPWLDDIVVENNGDLVMSFRDRTGDQMLGLDSPYFENTDGTGARVGLVNYIVGGDINKACKSGGTFVLDLNGGCGMTQEPGKIANEYFSGDGGIHAEAAYGGLALSRGERGIVTNSMDPADNIWTQGYTRVDRGTGRQLWSPQGNGLAADVPEILLSPNDGGGGTRLSAADQFGKGQGMADLEVLCELAPVQIGNRIWNDADGDGIQDPGEEPIKGVTVNLYNADGTPVMKDGEPVSVVTDERGEYYFDSRTDGVDFNTDYRIRLDNPDDYLPGAPLDPQAVRLTGTDNGPNDDLDNDGAIVNGYPELSVSVGDRGEDDHSLDFGFKPRPPASVSVGDYVWVDTDGDGIQEAGEPGIEGVVLKLTGPDGGPVRDINGDVVDAVTTDRYGRYSFDLLPPLEPGEHYSVEIDQSAASTKAALAPYRPTQAGQGGDAGKDSSTWTAESGDLVDDGDRDSTLDFGFSPKPVAVGDLVWVDSDADGVQDPGEPGIPGVVMQVFGPDGSPVTVDADGEPVGPVTTDANGNYLFTNLPTLPAGEHYTVKIDQTAPSTVDALAPYLPTQANQGGDPEKDSSTWSAESGDLDTPGAVDLSLDFGFTAKPVSVGDFVWVDTDGDGVQDPGEPGIPGVELTVVDKDGNPVTDVDGNPVGPVTTDANGHYVFANLPPSADGYTVKIDNGQPALETYVPTKTGQGGPGSDSSNGSATSKDLSDPTDSDMTLDFGFVPASVSVGDLVWKDADRDGVQDAGEDGIENVVLRLLGPDGDPVTDVFGNPVPPVHTDADGKYSFDLLPPLPAGKSYTVAIDTTHDDTKNALAGLVPTKTGEGTAETDSSLWRAESGDLTTDGAEDLSLDFGFYPGSVSVGDYVWVDRDGDGIQESGEDGIENVQLRILDPDGNPVTDVDGDPVDPVRTDADGKYSFDLLPPLPAGKSYKVEIVQTDAQTVTALAAYVPTAAGQGGDPAKDSSTWEATTGDLTTPGDRDATLDFGFTPKSVSVGDFVWKDLDGDGVQDAGEPGIEGVVLKVTDEAGNPVTDVDGNPVGNATTDEHGKYLFEDLPTLPAGQHYVVTIDQAASAGVLGDLVPTEAGQGGDAGKDSSTWTAESGDVDAAGAKDLTLDFGFVPPSVSVGDFVWKDLDGDGIQDVGEPGIKGVALSLEGPDGGPVTDIFGNPVEYVLTDADGKYSFDNLPTLPAGESYTVRIYPVASGDSLDGLVPTAAGQGGDAGKDSSTGSATSGDLTADGAKDVSLDFGFVPGKVSVGDLVWKDLDGDGVQEPGEPGIPGVVLKLTGPDGNPVTDIDGNPVGPVPTDVDGTYSFDDLPPLPAGKSYTVSIDAAASAAALGGLVPTKAGAGADRGKDSSTGSATSGPLLTDGAKDLTLDFGFTPPRVSVGDLVWKDLDGDGVQEPGEPGIPGVVLKLTGPDGNPVTDVDGDPVGPVTTAADGTYSFDDLPPLPAGKSYTVSIDAAASAAALGGLVPTAAGQGGDAGKDSSTGSATSGDLTADGAKDLTLDFGFVPGTASVGDLVWKDLDGDGVQEPGEPGIPGVVLKLTGPDGKPVVDADGKPVGPVTTGADGTYSFDNLPLLPAGKSYTVSIDAAASAAALGGLVPTKAGAGADRGTDSSTGSAASGDLTAPGARDATLDFGFVPTGSLSGVVWVDKDHDGVQDAGEPGIPGVVMVLTGPDGKPVTDVDGHPVAPVRTGPDGAYSFTGLPPLPAGQSYQVTIDQQASAGALADYQVTPTDPASALDFGFIPATVAKAPLKLKTKARHVVRAKVRRSGDIRPVALRDKVRVKHLVGTGKAVAKLYGPFAKRRDSVCTRKNRVGKVKFTVRNGTRRTPKITVRKPGVYTWVVTVKGANGEGKVSHRCGLRSETTRVQRASYGPVDIVTGVMDDPEALPRRAAGRHDLVRAASIRMRAILRTVGLLKGRMQVPEGRKVAGLLDRSAAPGEAIGTTVIAGHVSDDSDDPMAFWRLDDLKRGKIVKVRHDGKVHRYRVTSLHEFSRDHGPGIPKRYFRTGGAHRLVLVTCTDKVTYRNGHFHYTKNLVVVAKPVR